MAWFPILCAAAVALATPFFLVVIRHQIRLARLRALYEFDQLFGVSEPDSAPTYEYVRARYTDDIEFPEHIEAAWIRKFDMGKADFRNFMRRLRWWQVKSSRAILFASIPMTLMVFYGFALLFGAADPPSWHWLQMDSPLLITGAAATPTGVAILNQNVAVVAEAAFIGAYLFTLLLLLRALATFDLSPLTVIRATIYVVVGVLATVMLFISFPDLPAQTVQGAQSVASGVSTLAQLPKSVLAPSSTPAAPTTAAPNQRRHRADPPGALKPVSRIWLAIAFMLGFIPDLAINRITNQVQKLLRIKSFDKRLLDATLSMPLEVIDGIDVLTRFRLNESNIFEVQNLAVANPVMLFIETPFGIYQVIDWVAQAQLCMAVGPERFLELQSRSIRTIFDLERAVLSVYTTSQLRKYVASVLLSSPHPREDTTLNLLDFSCLPPAADNTGPRSAADFAQYAAGLFSQAATASNGKTPAVDPDESIKHLIRVMVDDLHVCRLRQVWQQIISNIDGTPPGAHASDRLWDTEWTPPLPDNMPAPPYPGRKVANVTVIGPDPNANAA